MSVSLFFHTVKEKALSLSLPGGESWGSVRPQPSARVRAPAVHRCLFIPPIRRKLSLSLSLSLSSSSLGHKGLVRLPGRMGPPPFVGLSGGFSPSLSLNPLGPIQEMVLAQGTCPASGLGERIPACTWIGLRVRCFRTPDPSAQRRFFRKTAKYLIWVRDGAGMSGTRICLRCWLHTPVPEVAVLPPGPHGWANRGNHSQAKLKKAEDHCITLAITLHRPTRTPLGLWFGTNSAGRLFKISGAGSAFLNQSAPQIPQPKDSNHKR